MTYNEARLLACIKDLIAETECIEHIDFQRDGDGSCWNYALHRARKCIKDVERDEAMESYVDKGKAVLEELPEQPLPNPPF